MKLLLVTFACLCLQAVSSSQSQDASSYDGSSYFPLLMPDVQPMKPETYLCTAFRMPHHSHQFIVEYLPNATKETAHHILIYGCEHPGYAERDTPRAVWDCGEMAPSTEGEAEEAIFPRSPICKDGQSQIVYSWAMDAPALKMPQGVGFKVGQGTKIDYLVLQVHYAHVHRFVEKGEVDHSGITLRMLPQDNNEINKLAGVLLMATDGRINGKTTEHFEAACPNEEPIEIHPFAFRTHTHKLGQVVTGYRIDQDTLQWTMIGKGDPQKPQMFYPVRRPLTIRQGDWVAARCTMYNFLDETVNIGSTGNDEMCNFYIMYYVNRMDRILDRKVCFTAGPPYYYWKFDINVPPQINKEASERL